MDPLGSLGKRLFSLWMMPTAVDVVGITTIAHLQTIVPHEEISAKDFIDRSIVTLLFFSFF